MKVGLVLPVAPTLTLPSSACSPSTLSSASLRFSRFPCYIYIFCYQISKDVNNNTCVVVHNMNLC